MYRKYLLGIVVITCLSLALHSQSSAACNSFNIYSNNIVNDNTQISISNIMDSGAHHDFLRNVDETSQQDEDFHEYNHDELKIQAVEQGQNESFNSVLQEFNPNLNVTSRYLGEEVEGEFKEGNVTLSLPSQGQYYIDGNISNLESQYIQNSGAENNQIFYSEDVINAGLSINRLKDSRSIEGEYVWKFYSNNTETMSYGLYQSDLALYNNDTVIEYSYLFESNSSIKNVINSSLIFDFVFDTSRIMVIHWHYTNINPPLIGDNTTSPFIVYRLLKNSSWNSLWNNYSLKVSDLFSSDDPYIPKMLKSVGIYVISPESSECSLLIDDFKIKTSLSPEDINLKANDIIITSVDLNHSNFEINIVTEEENSNYNVSWNHNSSFYINARYLLATTGVTNIIIEKQIVSYNSSKVILKLSSLNISDLINSINITYPDFWILKGNIGGFNITANFDLGTGFYLLTLVKVNQTNELVCEFFIPNLVSNVDFSSFDIFETINGTLSFAQQYSDSLLHIFWYGENSGSITIPLFNGEISFTFPSWVINGSFNVVFLVFDSSNLGITNDFFTIARLPSKLDIISQVTIPQYASHVINATYENLFYSIEIANSTLIAFLNDEQIPILKFNNQFQIQISAFYLTEGNYSLLVFAQSSSHASILQSIPIYVYKSNLTIDFAYEKIDDTSDFLLSFHILSDGFSVGFAPIIIEINDDMQFSGITNINGTYSFEIFLPLNSQSNLITCSIMKLYVIVASKSFVIRFNSLYAEISRTKEEVIIMDNITLTYSVQYLASHDQWFTDITDDMKPILDAVIQTETSFIPVYWDNDILYWGAQADTTDANHILRITTPGPEVQTSVEEEEKKIYIHFLIGSETKSYSKISLIYYMNDSFSSAKYNWQLFNNMMQDVTDKYDFQMNNLYAYVKNINVSRGNFLILDLIGTQISSTRNLTNLVVPLVSSSGILLGAITTIIKIYNKRKGMILEV